MRSARALLSAWDERIARAAELKESFAGASSLLAVYEELARFQKRVFEEISAKGETRVRALAPYFPSLLQLMERVGPPKAADLGRAGFRKDAAVENLLVAYWDKDQESELLHDPAATFIAQAILQPFAEFLAARAGGTPQPAGPASQGTCAICPFCRSRPAAAVLRGEGDGARRSLLCSLCFTEWQYRRVLCPGCGEEDKDKLPIYTADAFDYVRVEACESCRRYIKAVDLTRNGRAVPVVDEIATLPLNLWAEERNYRKLQPNILAL